MNLVNAELKSKEELKERLEAGEVFWQYGVKYHYEAERVFSGESPFRIGGNTLNVNWKFFERLQKEVLWHENIEEPVLCWVSEYDKGEKVQAKWIDSIDVDGWFVDTTGPAWRYATPLTIDDLTKD